MHALSRWTIALGIAAATATGAGAQAAATPPPPPATPGLDFSGVIYFRWINGGSRAARGFNKFDLERSYLTFRMPAGDNVSIRVTADVAQNVDTTVSAYYRGWFFRAKYAYMQWNFFKGDDKDPLQAVARIGMLHTPIVDYEEGFWPRGLATVITENVGMFSSSDLGVAALVTLPNKWGELYGALLNGSAYTSRETDRFKDFGGRLTLTPLASETNVLKTLAITPWYYKGQRASDFANGRVSTTGPIAPQANGLQKDRFGLHVGIKDPNLILVGHWTSRTDVVETAAATATAPTDTSVTGQGWSAFTLARPLAWINGSSYSPWVVVLRADQFKPNTNKDPYQRFLIAGLGYDMSKKATVYFDFQDLEGHSGSTADTKTFFAHFTISF